MKSAALALTALPVALMAQNATPLDAHVHGSGHLSFVFAETEIALTLRVPGADVVGFEEPAENEDDRAQVATAISDLSKPLELFVMPPDAGCVTLSANVALVGDAFGTQQDTQQEAHTEFQADFVVQCQDLEAANVVEFLYFQRFENAQNLRVQLTSGDASREIEVSRDMPVMIIPNPL